MFPAILCESCSDMAALEYLTQRVQYQPCVFIKNNNEVLYLIIQIM
jgi:hypothetical protein